jgi:multiple sugar transport system substrate-binding protein
MRKKVVIVGLIVLFFVLTVPMFAAGQAEEAEEEKSITFWHPFTQETRKVALESFVEEYEQENPNTTINVEIVPFPQIPQKWALAAASRTTPDVIGTTAWNAIDVYKAGLLVTSDELLEELGGWDVFSGKESIQETLMLDGKLLAMPLYANSRVLIYRKDILEAKGIEPPVTWDEYLEAARKLTNPPETYGFFQMWDSTDVGATMYHQIFGSSNNAYFFDGNGNPNLTSKENLETIEFMVELYKVGSPANEFGFTYRDVFNLFASGQAPMVLNSGFMVNSFESTLPELAEAGALGIGVSPFKVQPAGNATYTPIIMVKGEHDDVSKDFVKFLFDDDRYTRWVHALPGAMLPVLKNVIESDKYWDNPILQKYEDGVKSIISSLENKGYWPDRINENLGVITDYGIIEEMYQKIALGQATVEQAAAEANRALEERIKEKSGN